MMNDKIKNWLTNNWVGVVCVIAILCLSVTGYRYLFGASDIDTTGISNAQTELSNAKDELGKLRQRNAELTESINRSQSINDRTAEGISRVEELNTTASGRISDSQTEIERARNINSDSQRIIDESESILDRAEERNRQGK